MVSYKALNTFRKVWIFFVFLMRIAIFAKIGNKS